MANSDAFSEVVEAEGHLIDSQILNLVFDAVVKNDASFDVLKFAIGRSNDEPSSISMRISAPTEPVLGQVLEELVALGCRLAEPQDAQLKPAERDGCVPDDFYSTTNHRTRVRHGGQWIDVEHQRMDAVIVVDGTGASCCKLRDVRAGQFVVCGVAASGSRRNSRSATDTASRSWPTRSRRSDGSRSAYPGLRRCSGKSRRPADALRSWRVRSSCTPAGRSTFRN